MRYMLIVKSTGHLEAGVSHSRTYSQESMMYKQSLAKSGILLAAEELHPSSSGVRITYSSHRENPSVQVGPFPTDQSLIAEYALIDASSEEEAVSWALRMPVPPHCGEYQIELRKLKEMTAISREARLLSLEADLQDHLQMFREEPNLDVHLFKSNNKGEL